MKIQPLQDFYCGDNPNCTCARCLSISRALGIMEERRHKIAELTAACLIKDELIAAGWTANERHQDDKKRWAEKKHKFEFRIGWLQGRIRDCRAILWDAIGGDKNKFNEETDRLVDHPEQGK